jgi:hypothetical protein
MTRVFAWQVKIREGSALLVTLETAQAKVANPLLMDSEQYRP